MHVPLFRSSPVLDQAECFECRADWNFRQRSRFETLWEGVTIAYFPTFSIPLPTGTAFPLVVFLPFY